MKYSLALDFARATLARTEGDEAYIALQQVSRKIRRLQVNTEEDGAVEDGAVERLVDAALEWAAGCIRTDKIGWAGWPPVSRLLAERTAR